MRLWTMIVFCNSLLAWGCPNLTGNYHCPDANFQYTVPVAITQSITTAGVVEFQRTENKITRKLVANGLETSMDAGMFQGKGKFWCEGNVLKVSQQGVLLEDGSVVGSLQSATQYQVDGSGNLISEGEARVNHHGEPYKIDMGYKCLRVP